MKKTILSVDDEAIINLNTKTVLEQEGYRVITAKSGEQALAIMEEMQRQDSFPDLILMDIDMGPEKMDGAQIAIEIYHRWNVPIVFHSGHTDKETIEKTKEITKYGFVQKTPGNKQFLLATIEMALKLHESDCKHLASEKKYQDLLENMGSGVVVYEAVDNGEDFIFKDLNRAAETIDGESRENLIGKRLKEQRPGVLESGIYAVFRRVWETGVPEYYEPHLYKDSKRCAWYESYVYKLDSGEVIAVFRDVSGTVLLEHERNRYLEELEQLASIVEFSEDAIFYTDIHGRITSWNRGAQKIFGYKPEEIIANKVSVLTPDEYKESCRDTLSKVLSGKTYEHFVTRRITKTGELLYVSLTLAPIYDKDGVVTGVSTIARDVTKQKVAEQRLCEEMQIEKALFEQAFDGIILTDEKGNIRRWNKAMETMTGISRDEVLGEPIWGLINNLTDTEEGTKRKLRNEIKKVLSGGHADWLDRITEQELIHIGGGKIPVQSATFAIRTERGYLLGSEVRDVSVFKRSQRFIKGIADTAPNLLYVFDLSENRNVWCNQNHYKFLKEQVHIDPDTATIEKLFSAIHPLDHQKIRDSILRHTSPASDQVSEVEFRIKTKDGWRWMLHHISVLERNKEGTVRQFIGSSIDITGRKNAQEALIKSKSELQGILEAIPGVVSVIDPQLTVQHINRQLSAIIKNDKTDGFLGQKCYNVLKGRTAVCEECNIDVMRKTKQRTSRLAGAEETAMLGFPAKIYASPILDDNGDIQGFVESAMDITDLVATEAKLKTILGEKDYLLKEINHRVKNSLAMITSLINLKTPMLKEHEELEDVKNQINAIRMVHELLHHDVSVAEINLPIYLLDLLHTIFASFSEKKVTIEDDIAEVHLDSRIAIPLGLIINELATNAIKHGFVDGREYVFRVSFHENSDDGKYVLHVSNSGRPFPMSVDFSNTERLGLQIISSLVDQLDGSIELIREPETLFIITISR